jgi:hypothetical protein
MEGVGGKLGGVSLRRRETADCLVDGVYVDQGGL